MADITNNTGYLIHHLATSLARQTDEVLLHDLGIGFSQFKILIALQNDGGSLQKELAERLGQTEASISRQIKGLESARLLRIVINPANKREHRATLTTRGENVTEVAQQILNKHYAPMFDVLGEQDQQRLHGILVKMHQHVCQPGKPGSCDNV